MLKIVGTDKRGKKLITLMLEPENIVRLAKGDPIYFEMDELGVEGYDMMIAVGQKELMIEQIKKDNTNVTVMGDDNA